MAHTRRPAAARAHADEALAPYRRKRDFDRTPEPRTGGRPGGAALSFVVQKHHASSLHYDFRLELDGTLKSWAVPKGPCLDPTVKRMAVQVEDHPLSYAGFEGTIPPRQYGAGSVIVWDRGSWTPEGDARQGLAEGKLKFRLDGEKLQGGWTLVRMRARGESQAAWLLIKERDDAARPLDRFDIEAEQPDSVLSGRGVDDPVPAKAARAARTSRSPEKPAQAGKAAALPRLLAPQLAVLASAPPAQPADWLYELKFDGYRLLTRIDGGRVQCVTRNGNDWSDKLPKLVASLARLPLRSAWLDGEIVVADAGGAPDFQALQNAFDSGSTAAIDYFLFDLPFLDGQDLRGLPVEERRARLARLLGARPPAHLRFSEAFDAPPRELLASSARLGFEGIVAKRKGSAYVSRRSPDWIKLKNQRRQEFVIGGYTAPKGARAGFGSLLLGVHDDAGRLVYCGNVGTGFDAARLADIKQALDARRSEDCPFEPAPRGVRAQWVAPELVCEVAFGEWTRDGRIRHSAFQGLRTDKPARQVRRETAQPPPDASAERAPPPSKTPARPKPPSAAERSAPRSPPTMTEQQPSRVPRITHAERVIDAKSGITKGELVAYYAEASELVLPHLKGRPVALVRAPDGVGGELFFQKHMQKTELDGVRLLDPALDPGHDPLLQIDGVRGLLSAAQMNVIELHTWNATSKAIGKPDRMTFDLDPGEGIAWSTMQEAALLVHTLLDELGLPAFLKTSGGKGLHVVVPLRRQFDWDTVKDFSQAIVQHLADTIPDRFVAKSGPRNRVGRIFVDYLRNGFGATTASAWSARSRPGLGISVPLAWEELAEVTAADQWTVRNAAARFATGNRPWANYEKQRTALGAAMKRLGFAP